MNLLKKVRYKRNKDKVVYFRFFASEQYPGCFWHTPTIESVGFDISKINDFEPINCTWEDIKNGN